MHACKESVQQRKGFFLFKRLNTLDYVLCIAHTYKKVGTFAAAFIQGENFSFFFLSQHTHTLGLHPSFFNLLQRKKEKLFRFRLLLLVCQG